ncbi:MAG: cytochrome c peroxidase [Myxococcaceae bacterium]
MVRSSSWVFLVGTCLSAVAFGSSGEWNTSPEARLGEELFVDDTLSRPAGQSCASCHAPKDAFTDPDQRQPTSEGVIRGRFGARNTPTAAYAQFSPPFRYNADDEVFEGGQFLDGRASTLEDQAKAPFLNPLEMNNRSKAEVVAKVRRASYAWRFYQVYGPHAFDDVDAAYDNIARAIAEFERTPRFAPFTSRYDAHLAGRARLSPQEARGLALFNDPAKGNCAACHPSAMSADGTPPLFTDFTYDNIGIPRNRRNPFYDQEPRFNPDGRAFVDLGLGGALGDPNEYGKFKVGTLRNIAITGPYMHNGYFKSLKDVVHFYNTRDVEPWPSPEVTVNVNHDELGNLGLTNDEEDAIVAFLQTLTDGWRPGH